MFPFARDTRGSRDRKVLAKSRTIGPTTEFYVSCSTVWEGTLGGHGRVERSVLVV